jgi:zinc/manganese transport system substrate-binding protein
MAVAALLTAGASAACGEASDHAAAPVVVTTSIVGDIVRNLTGDDVDVEVVMPPNSDPHDFAPSAKQAQAMRTADVLVINGLGFEAGLDDTIDAAEDDGATVVALTDHAPELLAEDPHVFTDPARMAVAVGALADVLAERVEGLDTAAYRARVAGYLAQLEALDQEIAHLVDAIPTAQRLLVTNHDVFGYFADRYGFEVLGSVIPSITTLAEPSGGDLRELADLIATRGVPAIFAETSSPARLADALAAEGPDVAVVELFSESLGGPDSEAPTYLDLLRTDARRIVDALAPAGTPAG